jgi:aspartate/methionine/tyrosine aminotransferase
MPLAQRISRLGTESAFQVLARARALEAQGQDVVHFEIGEPDFDTPENIREAAKKAMDLGFTHYGPTAGLPETRRAIATYVSQTRNVDIAPEETIIVPGGKPIIFFTFLALIEPGDEVIYPNPGFPIYESMIHYSGAKAVAMPMSESNSFDLDPDRLESLLSSKTRLLILNSPANPTGGLASSSTIKKMAEVLRKFPDVMVLTDEIYSRIVYDGRHESIITQPGMKERCILLDGFSKTWAMTGWRLGYGVAPLWLIEAMTKLAANDHSCVPAFSQMAAIEALQGPQTAVANMVEAFKKRRDLIVSGLNSIPLISCLTPHASFYAFANIKATGMSSKEAADALLSQAGVACLPGTAFGSYGEGYLRFSYATSPQNIERGLDLIRIHLPRLLSHKKS